MPFPGCGHVLAHSPLLPSKLLMQTCNLILEVIIFQFSAKSFKRSDLYLLRRYSSISPISFFFWFARWGLTLLTRFAGSSWCFNWSWRFRPLSSSKAFFALIAEISSSKSACSASLTITSRQWHSTLFSVSQWDLLFGSPTFPNQAGGQFSKQPISIAAPLYRLCQFCVISVMISNPSLDCIETILVASFIPLGIF